MNNKIGISRELTERLERQLSATCNVSTLGMLDELRALLVAPVVEHQPAAWRGCNADGEVVTEWIDGAPPGKMVDLCGNPSGFDKIELAYTSPAEPSSQYTLTAEQFEAIEALLKENPASQNVVLQDLLARTSRWDAPVAVDAAKAFAKGFNTLETVDGKYKIVMQFAGRDDAWAAYTALSKLTRMEGGKP